MYEYATGAEARAQTGRNPVGLKWIDTNKSTTGFPRHRSRLVCTEVRHKGVEQVFSAAPPLDALRVLICIARKEDVLQVAHPLLISLADVSRAHFNADAVRNVHVRLPEEDSVSKEPGICGKLRKTMYGTLDAAQRWREHHAQVFEGGGFSRGPASPCHCADLAQGDDCFIVGRQKGREHALDLLQAVYEWSKVVTLGPGPSHSQAVTFLERTQTHTKVGDRVRAGQTARPTLIESTGADRCLMCCHPGN